MSGEVERALAGLSSALDVLASLDLAGISDGELLALADGLELARRRVPTVEHGVIAQLEQRHVAFDQGAHDTATLLVKRLRISRRAAKRRVLDAEDLGPDPALPVLAAAQAAGAVTEEHAGVVIAALNALPAEVGIAAVEAELVAHARTETPDQLRHRVRELRHRLDPDDAQQRAADHQRRRDLMVRQHADGSADITGHLTPEAGIKWMTILSAVSAPRPAVDGTPDERTAGQRRHDGLLDLADRYLSGALPDSGGCPVTLVITATADQVQTRSGLAKTEHGAKVDAKLALQLADTSEHYLLFDDISHELHLGRNKRLARPALRRALAARDGGCSFPDCGTPSSWCQAHHIREWVDGGPTDINNLTLVCGYHHREHQRLGWTCRIEANRAVWQPPPQQRAAA